MIYKIFFTAFAAVNILTFCVMGWDKSRAIRGAWRVPESVLFLFAICGGALGGVIGMRAFHHKTHHWQFKYGFPAILIIQLVIVFWLWVI